MTFLSLVLSAAWFYPQMTCEIHKLGVLREEARRAGMYAAHPGDVEALPTTVVFRRAKGDGTYEEIRRDARYRSAVGLRSEKTGWEALSFDGRWHPCDVYPDSETPPHLQRVAEDRAYADVVCRDGVYDAQRELLAYVECESPADPGIDCGESLDELANANPDTKECVPRMIRVGDSRWRTELPMAFRYFKFGADAPGKSGSVTDVRVVPVWRTYANAGAFETDNPRWRRMREVGVHTLRLCAQDFLLDGIKRDRLPWAGDLAVSLLANAYVYGDAAIVRDSLSAMDAYKSDVNGIVTYSMWTVVAHDLYQLYFGDAEFLARRWWRIKGRVDDLVSRCDGRGFVTRGLDWVFVDWVDSVDPAALQMVWVGALDAAARLADRVGDRAAADYRALAGKVRGELNARVWDARTGLYGKGRHASVYAVVFGVADAEKTKRIGANLAKDDLPPVGTPYVYGWELVALRRAGRTKEFFDGLEKVFGGMLDNGATTFWEGYDAKERGADRYRFYGRPFAKSLCHVWSAWPAFLFVSEVMGVKPTSDGWRTWEEKPVPGVSGLRASVPTPRGMLEFGGGSPLNLIPMPAEVTVLGGTVPPGAATVRETDAAIPSEGYVLEVRSNGVRIVSSDAAGAFYAEKTLAQLRRGDGTLPCVRIADRPAYGWRGYLLDCSRHFMDVATVKRILDWMADCKFNVFHWHLVDDQGWRVPFGKYPRLNTVGATRPRPDWVGGRHVYDDGTGDYGPFGYTEADIREIRAYAAARHIRILPEMEIPGHSREVVASYPELYCENADPKAFTNMNNIGLCLGNDATIRFFKDSLDRFCELFPDSEAIHIGGDECPRENWKKCPKCRKRMRELGLKSEDELQAWCTRVMADHLASKGRRAIGWNEIVDGGLASNALVMCWNENGRKAANLAIAQGNPVVMTPSEKCYFNMPKDGPRVYTPLSERDLRRAYYFDPCTKLRLDAKGRDLVLGGECCTWTERVIDLKDVRFAIFPRFLACAEALWTGPDRKPGLEDFKRRVARFPAGKAL